MRRQLKRSAYIARQLLVVLCLCAGFGLGVASMLQNNATPNESLIVAQKSQAPASRSPDIKTPVVSPAPATGSRLSNSKTASTPTPTPPPNPPPFRFGDVLVKTTAGIQRFDKKGTYLGIFGQFGGAAGMAFRANGNLLSAYFAETGHGFGDIHEFDTNGNDLGIFIDFLTDNDPYNPKSLAVDNDGNVYVGTDLPFGQNGGELVKYDPSGARLPPVFTPDVENLGIHQIALADQCTIYYTSAGVSIKRFDVCNQKQLSDFVSGGGGASPKGTLQIRANGDVLVQSNYEIDRYDSSGVLRQVYPFPTNLTTLATGMNPTTNVAVVNDSSGLHQGDDIFIDNEQMTVNGCSSNSCGVVRNVNGAGAASHAAGATVYSTAGATALALDPDGKHFWAAGSILFTGVGSPVYKYDIETGAMQLAFSAEFPVVAIAVSGLVDTDGDGLPDDWEKYGVRVDSAGNVIGVGKIGAGMFIDLPAMGADPTHKDLFVHADWMAADTSGSTTVFFEPEPRALKIVTDSFARAPVKNPDGKTGINLHIDAGPNSIMKTKPLTTWGTYSRADEVPFQKIVGSVDSNGDFVWDAVHSIEQTNFYSAGRQKLFRYALFASDFAGPTTSGCPTLPCPARRSGVADGVAGVDAVSAPEFLVTLGSRKTPDGTHAGTVEQQAGTFMHELGHTLGLQHGGGDDVNRKPNYLSVMSYSFQLEGVPKPFKSPLLGNTTQRDFDYSRLALPVRSPLNPVLDETNLDENLGISDPKGHFTLWGTLVNNRPGGCPGDPSGYYRLFFPAPALDWNCNGTKDTSLVSADINGDGAKSQLNGYEDWPTLIYNADGKIGLPSANASASTGKRIAFPQSTAATENETVDDILAFVPQPLIDEELNAPLDNVTYAPEQGAPGVTVSFDGTASTAIAGRSIVDWSWDFGDGTTGSGATTSHTYRTGGDFYASLTVTDSAGQVNLVPLLELVSVTGTSATPLPNIVPYQPPGWSDRIVVSNVSGTNTDTPTLTSSDLLYVDWAVINDGQASVNADFIVTLYLDGVARQNFLVPHPLDVNSYAFIEDYGIGSLNPGIHTIKIVADSSGVVDGTGQTHNEYSKLFSVTGGGPTPTPTPTPTPPAGCVGAQMTSPTNGSNIQPTTTFNWSPASGTMGVHLDVGTQGPGSFDIYAADQGTSTSAIVSNLAGTIYVRLTSYCTTGGGQFGNDIISYDYVFQAPNPTPTPTPTSGNCVAAQITSPANGSTIQSTTTFTWSAGTGNSTYFLFIGTKEPGGDDVFHNQYSNTATSATISNLPQGTLYLRLRSRCSGNNTDADYVFTVPSKAAGAGALDPTFLPTATENRGQVWATLVQPDGKIIVGGQFKSFGGCARSGIARLNADGTCDQTFDPSLALSAAPLSSVFPSSFGTDFAAVVKALALQSDGKVLAVLSGGGNEALHHGLYRFNSDGSLDATFNANIAGSGIASIAVQPDGKILVAGAFLGQPNGSYTTLARLNPDGSLDPSFVRMIHGGTTPVAVANVVALQPDGKIVWGGTRVNGSDGAFGAFVLARLNPDGTNDGTFNAPLCVGSLTSLALQPDGKIVAAGGFSFNQSCGTNAPAVARFNSDGSVDQAFTPPAIVASGNTRLSIQSDGKIVYSDSFNVLRLNSDGTADNSFNIGSGFALLFNQGGSVNGQVLTATGKIIFVGQFDLYNGALAESIVQVNSDGTSDNSFAPNGPGGNANVVALIRQPDRKWLVGLNRVNGSETKLNGLTSNVIGRLNADGTTDTNFNAPFTSASSIVGVAPQSDGRVIVSGRFFLPGSGDEFDLARLNTDGSLDSTFTPPTYAGNGPVLIQPDGKIVVAGFASGSSELILRLNSNGQLDATLQDLGKSASITSMLLQEDGKILIGGSLTFVTVSPGHTLARNNIARLNADGSGDATFDPGLGPLYNSAALLEMLLQPDGKILIAGTFSQYNGTTVPDIARLNSNGSLDPSFLPINPNTAQFGPAQGVGALALQADGKIIAGPLVAGTATSPMSLFRLNSDGSLDPAFALRSGIASEGSSQVNAIAFQADGKILIGGGFDIVNGFARMGLARLLPDLSVEPLSAVSRKTHGAAGDFDIPLPLTGPPGIECRSGGTAGNHHIIVTFPNPVAVDHASITSGIGGIDNMQITGNEVAIDLSGITNAQSLTVSLAGVSAGSATINVDIPITVLLGDTNGDGFVDAADTAQVKSQSGNGVTVSNLHEDVNTDGFIDSIDVAIVKGHSGTAVIPSPTPAGTASPAAKPSPSKNKSPVRGRRNHALSLR